MTPGIFRSLLPGNGPTFTDGEEDDAEMEGDEMDEEDPPPDPAD